jgi:hypothetical protein
MLYLSKSYIYPAGLVFYPFYCEQTEAQRRYCASKYLGRVTFKSSQAYQLRFMFTPL